MALQDTLRMLSQFQQMDAREQQQRLSQQQFDFQKQKFESDQTEDARVVSEREGLIEAMRRGTSATNEQIVGGPGPFNPSDPKDLALIMEEAPEYAKLLLRNQGVQALQTPGGTDVGLKLLKESDADTSADKSVFGQQLRGLGTDLLFLSQTYGEGKVPRNADELEVMTVAASQDPLYGDKRQDWSNDKTAGRLKFEGVAVDDPTQIIISDSKRGNQYRGASAGDSLKQQLTTATTEETGSLAVYEDLYSVSEELEGLFNDTLIGPFQGNIERMKSVFVDTPEFTKFKSIADRLRTIVYGFSGKQINETELVWLDGLLPKVYNPDENFLARLTSIKDWVADKQEAQLNEMRSARRFTGTKPLREREDQVSPERLKEFRDKMDKKLGVIEKPVEPKRIRIKLGG